MESQLSPALGAIFSTLLEEVAGIHYGQNDREIFESKLVAHAQDAGFESLLDYYYRLRYDDVSGAEMQQLIEALVVHETYFFRELPPLVQMIDGHITDSVRRNGRARIWSAACATGEEPLSVAMLLDQRGLLDKVEIVATDVSSRAIQRAKSGRFSRRAVRDGIPPELVQRYLDVGNLGVSIDTRMLAAVKFGTMNLMDAAAVEAAGTFDAILCRNVLFYFRDAQAIRVVERLGKALHPDGLLVVGISESLLRFGTALRCEEQAGCFFYRKAT
jgi:chemotaxis protein methyltransferase CheR